MTVKGERRPMEGMMDDDVREWIEAWQNADDDRVMVRAIVSNGVSCGPFWYEREYVSGESPDECVDLFVRDLPRAMTVCCPWDL